MPSLSTARRISNLKTNNAKTVGEISKENSDFLMEQTFENDIQAKHCYIYDYFHDDQPEKNYHITHENTTKTPIDAKFIIKEYRSIDKDQVGYYLQFRPSEPLEFTDGDELYYFEKDYRNVFMIEFPISAYVDIPDDRGVYRKWMVVDKEYANQFMKYLILPCDYHLTWVETDGKKRVKRKMWTVLRNQNSYTIGEYRDTYFAHPDNQTKIWMPLNKYTEKFWYNDDLNRTMRLVVSAPTEHPTVWKVTKIENTKPMGIQKLTLYQNFWDEHKDYIEKDEEGHVIGMYADYYDSTFEPIDERNPITTQSEYKASITASNYILKVGGSYKLLKVNITDDSNIDVTNTYSDATFEWKCFIGDEDITDVATWLEQKEFNNIKIKFPDDRTFLGQTLHVVCNITSDIRNLSASFDFELSI